MEAGEEVSIAELVGHSQKYDGRKVVIRGEVIGDILHSRNADYVWVNVCEQGNMAIGVFCAQRLLDDIMYKGSYNYTGDAVRIEGIFHRSCPAHNSETDIHADNITVVERGRPVAHPVDWSRLMLSRVLSVIAVALAIAHLIYSRRKPRGKRAGT